VTAWLKEVFERQMNSQKTHLASNIRTFEDFGAFLYFIESELDQQLRNKKLILNLLFIYV
jgi:hypothetical protein